MILQEFEIDDGTIRQMLFDLGESLIEVILLILSGFFEFFWNWLQNIILLYYFGDNPAVFLVGVIFIVTAFLIWRRTHD